MLATILAERYAKALLKASLEAGDLEDTAAQAEAVEQALAQAESLRRYLTRPTGRAADKIKLFSEGLRAEGGLTTSLLKFLKVVFENKREAFLPVMLRKFQEQVDETRRVARAELTSASALSPEELALIGRGLSERMGLSVELMPLVDPAVIGGLKLRVGDRVYDGTLARQLARLGEKMNQAPRQRAARSKISSKKKTSRPKARAKAGPKAKKAVKKPRKKKK
jgi:F-type H+-transporting ATPase subunit delta